MTRPIKPPPGTTQHLCYDLLTGRSPRKFYLKGNCCSRLNQILKLYNCSFRFFLTSDKPIVSTEESDKRLEAVDERSD